MLSPDGENWEEQAEEKAARSASYPLFIRGLVLLVQTNNNLSSILLKLSFSSKNEQRKLLSNSHNPCIILISPMGQTPNKKNARFAFFQGLNSKREKLKNFS